METSQVGKARRAHPASKGRALVGAALLSLSKGRLCPRQVIPVDREPL